MIIVGDVAKGTKTVVDLFKVQRIIQSYDYNDVLTTSPAIKSIMIIVGDVAKGTKTVVDVL